MKKLVLIASFIGLTACNQQEQQTVQVKRTEASISLKSTGELASSDTVTLGPPMVKHGWQQKLTYLMPEGTWVKKGQKVMSFDAQQQREFLREASNKLATEKQKLASQKLDSEQDSEQLKLDVAEAKMKLTKAQRKAEQDGDYAAKLEVRKLAIELKIAEKAFELSEYKRENKKQQATVENQITMAEVERLTAETNGYKKAVKSLNVKAPKDGIVVYVADHNGEKPAEGDQIYAARKVIELPNLDQMIVKTTIPEQNVSRIKQGQLVDIKIDAIPDKSFHGEVLTLGQVVRVKSKREPSMVFDAVIKIANPDTELMRPGMAVRLDIVERKLDDIVALPESVVRYGENGAYVLVKSLLGSSNVAVKIVGRQDGNVFIDADLSEGDEVIL